MLFQARSLVFHVQRAMACSKSRYFKGNSYFLPVRDAQSSKSFLLAISCNFEKFIDYLCVTIPTRLDRQKRVKSFRSIKCLYHKPWLKPKSRAVRKAKSSARSITYLNLTEEQSPTAPEWLPV